GRRCPAHARAPLLSRPRQQHGRRSPDPGRTRGGDIVMSINVALAGAGAFGIKHLDAIKAIDGVKVVSLVSRELAKTEEVAIRYGIPHATTNLAEALRLEDIDAVILCTPTPMHAAQAL